ncbi:MAG: phage major capsid protein [Candidatus Eisenbacteria sp.]|nr:phage major capsid protein [Candidatus Eisenbacteria bacterium]
MLYQKILELRRQREELTKEARALLDLIKVEKRQLTEEELKRFSEIEVTLAEVRTELDEKEREHRLQAMEGEVRSAQEIPAAVAAQRQDPTQTPTNDPEIRAQNPTVTPAEQDEFRTSGDFLEAMRFAPRSERMAEHCRRYAARAMELGISEKRAFSMGIGAEGGLFVAPEVMVNQLLKLSSERGIVRSRARVIPAGASPDAPLTIPALTQGGDGAEGGASVVWAAEGATMTETDAKIEDITLDPKEVTAYCKVTDKLLRNAPAAEAFIMDLLGQALASAEDYTFLRGNGAGKPLGVIYTPGRILITRNTASKWLYEDILAMQAALYPESQDACVWVGSRSGFVQCKDMKDSSGNRLYTDDNLVKGFPASLDGIPFLWSGRVPVLGTLGDLSLLDLSHYIVREGFGPLIGMSPHYDYLANKTIVKIVKSVDGQGWCREPLTLGDASTEVSPYVILK